MLDDNEKAAVGIFGFILIMCLISISVSLSNINKNIDSIDTTHRHALEEYRSEMNIQRERRNHGMQ